MAPPSAWTYVDARRTHEVRVTREVGRRVELVVREQAFGGSPADEVYVQRHTIAESWEQKMRLLALETRLALLGQYYRADPGGWTRVRLAQPRPPLDLAPMAMSGNEDTLDVHHFSGGDRDAVSLVALHQGAGHEKRTLLVRLDYAFPDTDGGRLQIVHSRLPPPVYRSALAGIQLDLAERGYRKAARDHEHLTDARTWAAMRAALDGILARVVAEASALADGLHDGKGRVLDARQLVLVRQAAAAAKGAASQDRQYDLDYEIDPAASAVEGKKPDVVIEELPADVFSALNEPRLLALHERWMSPEAEADLFARGERAIHLAMRSKRAEVRPDEQHLVSLLEASLLLRYALQKRIPVDPNVIKRVQHARAYL